MGLGAQPGSTLVGRTIGSYRVLESIGHGGMGDVYRGFDGRLKRAVALKAIRSSLAGDPVSKRRFLRETRLACRVTHPYVATVFDVLDDAGSLLLVMEYIDGRRLDVVLREDRPGLKQMTGYAVEIAEALAAIHETGLVHHDLKPSNVMVTRDGHVKVTDFGLAQLVRPVSAPEGYEGSSADTTMTVGVQGTLQYMSPEQLRGQPLDSRSDLFSFGVLLYEGITGQHPFQRDSPIATASAILNEPPGAGTEPRSLSESGPMRELVHRLLEKDPARRYPSAGSVVEALRATGRSSPLPAPIPVEGPALWRRRWLLLGAFAALSLVIALWPWVGWGGRFPWAPRKAPALTLAVLPLHGSDGSNEAALLGSAAANMLRDTFSSEGFGIIGSSRINDLLRGAPSDDRPTADTIRSVMEATGAPFLVTGEIKRIGGEILAALEIHDQRSPARIVTIDLRAASIPDLIAEADGAVKEKLGLVHERQGSGSKDSVHAGQAGAGTGRSEEALIAEAQGLDALDKGSLTEAERRFGQAVRLDPGFVRVHMERAKALYQAGYVTRARESIQKALQVVEASGQPLPIRLGEELEAIRCRVWEDRACEDRQRRRLAAEHPEEPEVWGDLAESYLLSDHGAEALEAISEALRRAPNDPTYHLSKGSILLRLNRLEEAEDSYRRAERLDSRFPGKPLSARIVLGEGGVKTRRGEFEAARALYRQAASLFAAQGQPLLLAQAYQASAQAHLLQGNLATALKPLEDAAKEFADAGDVRAESECLDSLGALLYQSGDQARAEPILRNALAKSRDVGGDRPIVNPMLNLASLLNDQGRGDEARPLLEEAIRIAKLEGDVPRQATALLIEAAICTGKGQFGEAEDRYRDVIELLPKRTPDQRVAWAWTGIAEIKSRSGDLGVGLEAANQAVKAHRATGQTLNLAFGLLWLARLERLVGDRESFLRDLRLAEQSASESKELAAGCLLDRGIEDLVDGNLVSAEKALKGAFDRASQTAYVAPHALAMLGVVQCRSGRAEEGVKTARRGLSVARGRPDEVAVRTALAFCLVEARSLDDARGEALRALDGAEACEMRWEIAVAAGVALSLPSGARPASANALRERGRRALQDYLRSAPGGVYGPISKRKDVVDLKRILGISS